ncbi:flagellar basal body rod protein FlgB [Sporolactobacillus shoreicorticis]|uniref:Flagellar basal body rod protein FlgB n=1 Tax=Sporolactobacillus shoreicorticis TaxID=1923877 RepID=A0ABW5S8D6_9BACL|nr:flagellar basal body rod protein FlgB [Sporolactobacillus shoreicorticis]MCO7126003.1 flagellar basal body rod protein FlgB [Sporolactobacillus shoreicorticis]
MISVTPLTAIERALNGSMAEQNAIAQNIANVDTPNYKAQKVTFDRVLQNELKANRTNASHISFSSSEDSGYRTVTDNYGTVQNNGNNVDLDHEMSDLAQNQLLYQTLSQAASDQFKKFNIVLGGA